MKKQLLFTLIAICMLFAVGTINASAQISSTCGTNLTWTLENDTLTISGQGDMDNWSFFSTAPWYDSREDIVNVVIEENVTSIGDYAFYNCTNLESITIPASVANVGWNVFEDCPSFKNIIVDDKSPYYCSIDGVLFDQNQESLICYPAGKPETEYVIADTVTTISFGAFYHCKNLVNITIPDSVTSIESDAFYGCTNLESIVIPDSVTSLSEYAFYECKSLTTVTISGNIKHIGFAAFYDCNNLMNVYYNGKYVDLSIDAMNEPLLNSGFSCEDLSIHYEISFDGTHAIITYATPAEDGHLTVPEYIGQYPVTTIDNCAFEHCDTLKSIYLPDSITTIGESAFFNCNNLEYIELPYYLTNIGACAFSYCTNLKSIDIPGDITTISTGAFYGCESLEYIGISDGVTTIEDNAFSYCLNLENIEISNNVTTIGNYAFEHCTSLKNISIPASVTTIGSGAFSGCQSLTDITVNEQNSEYSSVNGILFDKNQTVLLQYPAGKTKTKYVISDGVTTVGTAAFFDCKNLVTVTLPESVTTICNDGFHGCENLVSITMEGKGITIEDRAFYGCDNFTDIYCHGTEDEWYNILVGANNEPFMEARIHYVQVQYQLNGITLKDFSGNTLDEIPAGTFLATISFTNVNASEDAVIILAQYTSSGAMKGLLYIQTEAVPVGSTLKLSIPVDNSKGDVANLKAFCWKSFDSLTPAGNSVSFIEE